MLDEEPLPTIFPLMMKKRSSYAADDNFEGNKAQEKEDQIMISDKGSLKTADTTNQSENSTKITKSRIGKNTWVFTIILQFLEND
jgi:hypothetical protein